MRFKNYKKIKESEEFNLAKAVKDAEGWLKGKYGDRFVFKHIENMTGDGVNMKSYDIVVGSNVYKLNLRKFDTNGDGTQDTVGFQVLPSQETPKEEDDF